MKILHRVLALTLVMALFIGLSGCRKKDNTPDINDNIDNTVDNYTPPPVVPDVKDQINNENTKSAIEESTFITENFNVTEGKTFNAIGVGEKGQFRVIEYTNYEGTSKGGTDDSFNATVTQGLSGNPDVSVQLTSSTLTQEEVEEVAYEIIGKVCGTPILDLVKETEYNAVSSAVDDAEDSSYITIQKIQSSLGEDLKSYSYGVKFQAGVDNLQDSLVLPEYDKMLYTTIPGIAMTNLNNLNDRLCLAYIMMGNSLKNIEVTSYAYTTSATADNCEIGLAGYNLNDERIVTTLRFVENAESGLVTYSYKTMTGYSDSREEVLREVLDIIYHFDYKELKAEQLTLLNAESANDATGYMYSYMDTETFEMYSISVNQEYGIGYFATVDRF